MPATIHVASHRRLGACRLGVVFLGLSLIAAAASAQAVVASATWSANGHTYTVVEFGQGANRSWAAADGGVEAVLGPQHLLATITSAEEDAFVRGLLAGLWSQWWVGGYQQPGETDANAGWTWVTGEPFGYANWCEGEPNDAQVPAREQHLALAWGGICWNDEGSAVESVRGYVAETPIPTLVSRDSAFGPATLTLDAMSGLKWLDVPLSGPWSYDGIVAQIADRNSPFSGYRLATVDEVLTFLQHAGIPPANDVPTEYYAPIRRLMTYVGVTGRDGNLGTGYPFDFTSGHVLGKHANGWVDLVTVAAYTPTLIGWVGLGTVPSTNDNSSHGAWLVAVPVPLTVTRAGTGLGTVVSDVSGIACGDDCAETYPHGTVVTLTATPQPGHRFEGWAGACASIATTCQVVMEAVRDVTANFSPPRRYVVTVSRHGPGSGTVTSLPPGIDCGSMCQGSFLEGTWVTLQASAVAGAAFAGWTGACTGKGPCVLPMWDHASVSAGFADAATDHDADLLPDAWEASLGLDPASDAGDAGSTGDPDHDGKSNLEEWRVGTHPVGLHARYFAEGATIAPFGTRLGLLNLGSSPSHTLLRYLLRDGTTVTESRTIPPRTRQTVDCGLLPALLHAEFSTVVESDELVVADRTMWWDATQAYGAHAETGVVSPERTWYLAEGATHGGFNLFYLLQNPNAAEVQLRVRYLRPSGPPLEKLYRLAPHSRTNIWVDYEEFPDGSGNLALADSDVSAVLEVLDGQPIIVERAMYADVAGQFFGAGHESAGVTAPAIEWFLAEGSTGPYFDLFVLIANPGPIDAHVEATYMRPDGTTTVKPYTVAGNSRFNIWVDHEGAELADTAVSTTIRSTNSVPIIVERAMWWPGPTPATWHEAHNSAGATTDGTRWALAEGEVDASRNLETYILVANTSPTSADVKVTLLFEDGTSSEQTYTGIPARSRLNVPVGELFPEAARRRFGAIVESVGAAPARIVVERAMYWDAAGQNWAAGTNALATRLQ